MRVLVLADTHAPRRWRGVPDGLRAPLAAADVILHAGDVCTAAVLDELAVFAPVHVVPGNNDGTDVTAWGASPELVIDLEGSRLAMVHDAGPRVGRAERRHRRFPGADLVVYGHSHIPLDEPDGLVHLFNPGSPTDRRRQPVGTYGVLEIQEGRLLRHEILPVE